MLSAELHRGNREASGEESYGRFLDNRFRYYSPELGRYISADPIGQAGGVNLYNYASNSPVVFVDPWGLLSYLVSRPAGVGGGFARHNFVVSNAKYIGDPEATVHSFGQNSDLNMGNVGPDGSPSSVAEQTYADDYAFWKSLGSPDACMVDDSTSDAVSSIAAADSVVDDLASRVVEDQDYSLLTGPFSLNSNSAAQAIANRAAGREVPTPGGWSPGSGKADRVRFSGGAR